MRSLSPYVLALLASVAACGKVQPSTTDGGNTGPDADTSGDATVTTEAAVFGAAIGAKVGNIDIVSTLPNGKVLAAGKTDGTGNGTIKVFPGGAVTAIYKHANDMGAELITWTGVAPGDHLTFGSKQPYSGGVASTNLGSQNYTFPTLAGANVYVVYTSCGANSAPAAGTSVTISEFNTCHIEPMDALYIAYNASSVLIGYNYRQNVAFSNGASVAIGGWGTAANATVTMTGLPPEVTNVNGGFRTISTARPPSSSPASTATPPAARSPATS